MKNILITFTMIIALIIATTTCYCVDPPDEKWEIELANRNGNNCSVEASDSHYINTAYKEGDGNKFDLWDVWEQL